MIRVLSKNYQIYILYSFDINGVLVTYRIQLMTLMHLHAILMTEIAENVIKLMLAQ